MHVAPHLVPGLLLLHTPYGYMNLSVSLIYQRNCLIQLTTYVEDLHLRLVPYLCADWILFVYPLPISIPNLIYHNQLVHPFVLSFQPTHLLPTL